MPGHYQVARRYMALRSKASLVAAVHELLKLTAKAQYCGLAAAFTVPSSADGVQLSRCAWLAASHLPLRDWHTHFRRSASGPEQSRLRGNGIQQTVSKLAR